MLTLIEQPRALWRAYPTGFGRADPHSSDLRALAALASFLHWEAALSLPKQLGKEAKADVFKLVPWHGLMA